MLALVVSSLTAIRFLAEGRGTSFQILAQTHNGFMRSCIVRNVFEYNVPFVLTPFRPGEETMTEASAGEIIPFVRPDSNHSYRSDSVFHPRKCIGGVLWL